MDHDNTGHQGNPKVPAGLANALAELENKLEAHMSKENATLFPAMREAGKDHTLTDLVLRPKDFGIQPAVRKID